MMESRGGSQALYLWDACAYMWKFHAVKSIKKANHTIPDPVIHVQRKKDGVSNPVQLQRDGTIMLERVPRYLRSQQSRSLYEQVRSSCMQQRQAHLLRAWRSWWGSLWTPPSSTC